MSLSSRHPMFTAALLSGEGRLGRFAMNRPRATGA